jgi:histidine triad (HIT) family protein
MAFPDIAPIAPVHILIIPKKHIASINDITNEDHDLISRMIYVARDIAEENGIASDGYKLLFRTGRHGGQEVPHIHLHLIGGAQLYEKIGPKEEMEK